MLLLASALLSGCATINPFADKVDANNAPEPANTKQIAEKPNETVKAVDPATLEMQRALDLILAANRYRTTPIREAEAAPESFPQGAPYPTAPTSSSFSSVL
jgi:hypothetical protein